MMKFQNKNVQQIKSFSYIVSAFQNIYLKCLQNFTGNMDASSQAVILTKNIKIFWQERWKEGFMVPNKATILINFD